MRTGTGFGLIFVIICSIGIFSVDPSSGWPPILRQFIQSPVWGVVGTVVVEVVVVEVVVVMTSFCLQFITGLIEFWIGDSSLMIHRWWISNFKRALFFLEHVPSAAKVYVLKISSSPSSSTPFAFLSQVNLILASVVDIVCPQEIKISPGFFLFELVILKE